MTIYDDYLKDEESKSFSGIKLRGFEEAYGVED